VKRSVAFLLFLVILFLPAASAAERQSRWRGVWRLSAALLVGANAADIASSWGKNEANPLVRTGQRFGYGSAAIKAGVLTGGLLTQYFLIRKAPRQTPYAASANLALTAVLAAVAARNMQIPAPPH
jgi:hypothetical protein